MHTRLDARWRYLSILVPFVVLLLALTVQRGFPADPASDLTVDGASTFQVVDGFGVNANSAAWNPG